MQERKFCYTYLLLLGVVFYSYYVDEFCFRQKIDYIQILILKLVYSMIHSDMYSL